MNHRVVLAVLFAVGTSVPVLAADAPTFRYIAWFNGPRSAYAVVRGAQQLSPDALGMALQPGDCVKIVQRTNAIKDDNENRMTLKIDGREVRLDASMSSYCVGAATNVPAPVRAVARAFQSVAKWFTTARDDYYTERTEPTVGRGGTAVPPSIPLLRDGVPKLAAGSRALALGWTNGKPPFDVSLRRDGVVTAIDVRHGIVTHRVRFATRSLTAGAYRVEIKDAARNDVVGRFAVVPVTSLPAPDADQQAALADPALRADERAMLDAARLAQTSPDWKLEAYQLVAGFAATSDAARALDLELIGGEEL